MSKAKTKTKAKAKTAEPRTTLTQLSAQYPDLKAGLKRLAPQVGSPEDLQALEGLLAAVTESRRVSGAELCDVLPDLRAAAGAATFAEVCELMQALIADQQYLGSITAGFWQDNLRKVAAALPAGLSGRMAWLAKLNRYADPLPPGITWIATAEDAECVYAALDAVMSQSYGYSDRDTDLKAFAPTLFACAAHLVHNVGDFELLCAAMPGLLRSLPEESEDTPIGYIHTYDSSAVQEHARAAETLIQFLTACGV